MSSQRITASLFVLWGILCLCRGPASLGAEVRAEIRPEDVEFFEKHVRPTLVEACFSCHSEESKKLKGGLKLDSRAQILVGGDSGPAVVPEKPDESLLVKAI